MAALVLHRIISVQIGDKMKLGEYQDLYYMKKVDFGVYLAEDPGSETHVLLPTKTTRLSLL